MENINFIHIAKNGQMPIDIAIEMKHLNIAVKLCCNKT